MKKLRCLQGLEQNLEGYVSNWWAVSLLFHTGSLTFIARSENKSWHSNLMTLLLLWCYRACTLKAEKYLLKKSTKQKPQMIFDLYKNFFENNKVWKFQFFKIPCIDLVQFCGQLCCYWHVCMSLRMSDRKQSQAHFTFSFSLVTTTIDSMVGLSSLFQH